jgi:CRP/FNR family cyclic AMP-dependent transcriptional regulator
MKSANIRPARLKQFNPDAFLSQAGIGRLILEIPKKKRIFSQGDVGDAVFYIQKGRIKLSVVSGGGKRQPSRSWDRATLLGKIA